MEKQNAQIFPVSRGIFALCGGHIESGTHLRQNIVDGSEKACHGFLDRKKFRFSAGLLNGAVGRLRGAFYHRFYGGREGRMGGSHGRREGRYSKPPAGPERSPLLAREPYSPRIHPNRYAMLICILRSRQFSRINMLICFCARCRGRVAAHLFRLDVKPCAVARRKAEIDTRASAPHGH